MIAFVAQPSKRVLRLEYSGNLINHLGLKLYAGAVPALSELISNSWDADASEVQISLPLGVPLAENQQISVWDNGRGMSWEDARDQYLVIGRDRRIGRSDKSPGGRSVMGRKGIGKLAGFGIARIVEVRTVRNRWLTHFRMNFDDMTGAAASTQVERYEPEILADEPTSQPNQTTITLTRIILQRKINEEEFRESMSRRFSVLSPQFKVIINGEALRRDLPLQFRFPQEGSDVADIQGFGKVRYWIGMAEKPIKTPDGRGISVIVRGKQAQTPFFFGIRGGISAQHALEYMTGEVYADQLDDATDFIGTNRQEVVWSEEIPSLLLTWGQELVRNYAIKWRASRNEQTLAAILKSSDCDGLLLSDRIEKLPERRKKEARRLVEHLVSGVDKSDDEFIETMAGSILSVFEDQATAGLLADLRNAPDRETLEKFSAEYAASDRSRVETLLRGRSQALAAVQSGGNVGASWKSIVEKNFWMLQSPWAVSERNDSLTTYVQDRARSSQFSVLRSYSLLVLQMGTKIQLLAIGGGHWKVAHLRALESLAAALEKNAAGLSMTKPRVLAIVERIEPEIRQPSVHVLRVATVIKRGLRSFPSLEEPQANRVD